MRKAFVDGLIAAAEKNRRIFLLTGDLGYHILEPYASRFPDRYINVGVAESNLVTVAGGLATAGYAPFIYSIATFATMRAFEQIRNIIGLQALNVKLVGVGAGLAYTKAGPTHHGMEDIALMRAVPAMTVIAPADPNETYAATVWMATHKGPGYLRIERNPDVPVHSSPVAFSLGKGYIVRKGHIPPGVAILATGAKVTLALAVASLLAKKDMQATVVAFPTIAPLDGRLLATMAVAHRTFVTIEEHRISGGFGTAVGEWVLACGMQPKPDLLKFGLPDGFFRDSGSYDVLMKAAGLSPDAIMSGILRHLGTHPEVRTGKKKP